MFSSHYKKRYKANLLYDTACSPEDSFVFLPLRGRTVQR